MSSTSHTTPEYAAVWRYSVRIGKTDAFLRTYGQDGSWVALFRKSPDFIGTELFRDEADPSIFVTIDRWRSSHAYKAFRTAFAAEYLALDTQCSDLTEDGELIAESGRA